MSIDKNDLTYIPSEIGNKERFINDGDSRIGGGATKYCTCNTTTGERTVEGTHHDITCPMNPFYKGGMECAECTHIMEKKLTEEGHWYSNHYDWCSSYGVCAICKANIGNGEPHKNSCMFTKCTCGNDGKPGPEHDPSCPKYTEPIYPICPYCGKNGKNIPEHLIWCPNYDEDITYDTCMECGSTNAHESWCTFVERGVEKSNKMCTNGEIYNFIFEFFGGSDGRNDEYCPPIKQWAYPDTINVSGSNIFVSMKDEYRDKPSEQLFPLYALNYVIKPLILNLSVSSTDARPDYKTIGDIFKSVTLYFKFSHLLPPPKVTLIEELSLKVEIFYYDHDEGFWYKHTSDIERIGKIYDESRTFKVNKNGDEKLKSFDTSEGWLKVYINDIDITSKNDDYLSIYPYDKRFKLYPSLSYETDYSNPDEDKPEVINIYLKATIDINRGATQGLLRYEVDNRNKFWDWEFIYKPNGTVFQKDEINEVGHTSTWWTNSCNINGRGGNTDTSIFFDNGIKDIYPKEHMEIFAMLDENAKINVNNKWIDVDTKSSQTYLKFYDKSANKIYAVSVTYYNVLDY